MTDPETKDLLGSCALFTGLDEGALQEAASVSEKRGYEKNELLLGRGERLIGVIASGYALVTKSGRDGCVTMSILGPGDVFGAASLMGGKLPSTLVRAIKPVTALVFPEESFLLLMEKHFALTQNYCRYLVGRIRFLTERVECMAVGTASEKLWRYVEKNAENGVLHLSFGMDALANALSISRASLYRAFDELENSGKLSRRGHEIRIL